jgi:NAD(P)-dependent dehydrogenase (short-subunit alcohol dehydrogenase family)
MSDASAGNVALVTGGGRGIGLGISKALARDGYDLAICGVRDAAAVADVLTELRSGGTRVEYYQADISKPGDRETLVAGIRQDFGRLNLLINNAGVAPKVRADILEATEESFDRLVSINLKGPYFLTQQVARWMVEQKQADMRFRGCIISVSSISARVASTSRGDYCITKAGVSMATKLWAARLGEFGIPVYEIQPGIIQTDMTSAVTEKYDKLIADGLLVEPRWGTPEDVGTAAAALARGDIPYATGQVISVDGGLTLQRL